VAGEAFRDQKKFKKPQALLSIRINAMRGRRRIKNSQCAKDEEKEKKKENTEVLRDSNFAKVPDELGVSVEGGREGKIRFWAQKTQEKRNRS